MQIPGADQFVIDEAKIRDYLLSPEHRVGSSKAKFFARLGFEQQDWPVLQSELARFVYEEAVLGDKTKFGQKYVVAGPYTDPLVGTPRLWWSGLSSTANSFRGL